MKKQDTVKTKRSEKDLKDEDLEYLEELDEEQYADRTLTLKGRFPDRKKDLMAHGVREIRCVYCRQVQPIAGATEHGEGWICQDCLNEVQEPRYGGQRGR
jgi:hypothetical protein